MEVATLEGLDGAPGKQKRRSDRRTSEVVAVRRHDEDPDFCVPSRHGPVGSARMRMIDLCAEAGIPKMNVAGRIYDTATGRILGSRAGTSGLEGVTMSDYEAMDFPAIESLEMIDGLIDKSYCIANLKTLGFQLLSRVGIGGLGLLQNVLPGFKGSPYVYSGVRALLGLAGGRALWQLSPELGRVLTSRALERVLVDDLLIPLLPASIAPYLGAVDIEPVRELASLTAEEARVLSQLSAVGIEEQQFGAVGIEEQQQLGAAPQEDQELILSAINPRYVQTGSFRAALGGF